jgi:hypothetical protein
MRADLVMSDPPAPLLQIIDPHYMRPEFVIWNPVTLVTLTARGARLGFLRRPGSGDA